VFIVLVTDFVNVHAAFGPFETREAARVWAESRLREDNVIPIYRVVPLNRPGSDQAPGHMPD